MSRPPPLLSRPPQGSALRGPLQVRLPESALQGAERDGGGVPGEDPPLPGQLHGHHRCHLRDVHQDERRAQL